MKHSVLAIRLSFLVYSIIIFPFFYWNTPIHFLFIDSLLAYVPIEFYFLLRKASNENTRLIVGFLYVLFLPNNAYLLTDLIHLNRITFYTQSELIMTENPLSWLMFALVISGIFGLFLLGFQTEISLIHHLQKKNHWSTLRFFLVQTALFVIVSCGVFLGRFLRWNSTALFTHPDKLFASLGQLLSINACLFILFFSFIQVALYGILFLSNRLFSRTST